MAEAVAQAAADAGSDSEASESSQRRRRASSPEPQAAQDSDRAESNRKRERRDDDDDDDDNDGHRRGGGSGGGGSSSGNNGSGSGAGGAGGGSGSSDKRASRPADGTFTLDGPQVDDETLAKNGDIRVIIDLADIGRVIGKQKINLRRVSKSAGSRLRLDGEGDEPKVLVIAGTPKQIRHSLLLFRLKMCPFDDIGRYQAFAEKLQEYTPTLGTIFFDVPEDRSGRLIGKGGLTIRDIQDRFNVVITLPKLPDQDTNQRTCIVSGEPGNAMSAFSSLQERLNYRSEVLKVRVRVRVLEEYIGRLIGRKGAVFREIQDMSRCVIDIPREEDKAIAGRIVVISGMPDAVEYCLHLIYSKITLHPAPPPPWVPRPDAQMYGAPYHEGYDYHQDASDRSYQSRRHSEPHADYGRGGPEYGGGYGRPDYHESRSERMVISIPSNFARRFASSRDPLQREIEHQTRTRIQLCDSGSRDSRNRDLAIFGAPHDIIAANELLQREMRRS